MSDEIQQFNDIINRTFENIQLEKMEHAGLIVSVWEKVLLGIRSYNPHEGKNLVDHSRIIDLKNGVLLVEADHPGWIELLQLHKKFILNGIRMYAPRLSVSTIAFRLKGRKGNLFDPARNTVSVKDARGEMARRMEQEERMLRNVPVHQESVPDMGKKESLPPELTAIFEDLKKSMLTNSKN